VHAISTVTPSQSGSHRRRGRTAASWVVVVAVLVVAGLVIAGVVALAGASPSTAPAAAPAGGAAAAGSSSARANPGAAGRPFQLGIVGSEDPGNVDQVSGLGARLMRAEFTPDTTVEQLEPLVAATAARGIRLQPLVGWDDGTPTPDLTAVSRWAAAFGPRGTFWAGRSDATAITDIELGNENSFSYKSGDVAKSTYRDLATTYGHRAADAARAVDAANPAVGVLVELESGDTDKSTWIDAALGAGGPDLVRLLHAPVTHAYGPDWRRELDQDFRFVAKWGLSKPFFMTEWGISTDNGPALSDNYDFPTDLTYAAAAALLAGNVDQMATVPGELKQVLLYQVHDQREPGETTDREGYFGIVNADGAHKGPYTAVARNDFRRF